MKKNFLLTLGFLVILLIFSGLGYYGLHKEKVTLLATVDEDFISALNMEMEGRMISRDSMIYQIKDSTLYIRKGYSCVDEDILQTLDSIFADKLSQKGYPIATGIRYVNKHSGTTRDSKPGHSVYADYSTQPVTSGASKEIEVQGFYSLTISSLFRKAFLPFIMLSIAGIISIAGFSFFFFRKKEKKEIFEKKEFIYVHASEIQEPVESDLIIKINDSIYFDPTKSEIHYKENQVISLSTQMATLFGLFLKATDYYRTNTEINQLLWKYNETPETRNKAIQRLREKIKPIAELNIKNINKKGYQLQIVEKRTNE